MKSYIFLRCAQRKRRVLVHTNGASELLEEDVLCHRARTCLALVFVFAKQVSFRVEGSHSPGHFEPISHHCVGGRALTQLTLTEERGHLAAVVGSKKYFYYHLLRTISCANTSY